MGPSGAFQRAGTHPPGPTPIRRRPLLEPAVAAGGTGAPRQGLGRGLRLTQQEGGSSACQEGDKASPYRELSFQPPPSERRGWALVKAERVPFMSPSVLRSSTCPCAHRTVASMLESAAWGQRLREGGCNNVPPSLGLWLAMWPLQSHRNHLGPGFAIGTPEAEISEQQNPAVSRGGLGSRWT